MMYMVKRYRAGRKNYPGWQGPMTKVVAQSRMEELEKDDFKVEVFELTPVAVSETTVSITKKVIV